MGAMQRITVDLEADMADAMRRSVEGGEYASSSDIINDALRDWANARAFDEGELNALRAAVAESDASGPAIPAEEVYAEIEALIASYERQ